MSQNKTSIRLLVAVVAVIFVLVLSIAPASAGEITITAPQTPATAGEHIILPVVMTEAKDIAGITFDVANNVPGVSITISDLQPLKRGSYLINSDPENPVQRLVWFSASGITADSVELFALDIVVSSSAAATIPITITPVTIVNSNSGFLTEQYPVVSADIRLTGSTVGKITQGVVEEAPTAEPTAVPTVTAEPTATAVSTSVTSKPTGTAVQTPATEKTQSAKTSVPTTVAPTNTIVPTPAQSSATPQSTTTALQTQQTVQPAESTTPVPASPLGILSLIGFATAAIILRKKE